MKYPEITVKLSGTGGRMNQDEEYKSDVIADQAGAELAELRGESEAEVPGMFKITGEYKCKNRLLGTNIRLTFVQFGEDLKFKKGYYLTCDSHGDFKNDNINKKDALFYMRKPWIWCDECAALHFNQEGYVDGDDEWVDAEKMMWNDKNGGF